VGKLVAVVAVVLVVAFFAVGTYFIVSIGESDFTGDFDLSGVTTYEPCLRAPGGCPCLRTRDCAQRIKDFRDHPVFWLGAEFDGLPLTRVEFIDYGERGERRAREVVLTYGTCVIERGQEGCGIPLSIHASRFCETSPAFEIIEGASGRADVRGAEVYTSGTGSSLWLRTSNVAVHIQGKTDSSSAGEIVLSLVSANGEEPDSAGESFPAPVSECYPGSPTPRASRR
jgi:hypothetical protein